MKFQIFLRVALSYFCAPFFSPFEYRTSLSLRAFFVIYNEINHFFWVWSFFQKNNNPFFRKLPRHHGPETWRQNRCLWLSWTWRQPNICLHTQCSNYDRRLLPWFFRKDRYLFIFKSFTRREKHFEMKKLCTLFSGIALKLTIIRWIRTGSQTYSIVLKTIFHKYSNKNTSLVSLGLHLALTKLVLML